MTEQADSPFVRSYPEISAKVAQTLRRACPRHRAFGSRLLTTLPFELAKDFLRPGATSAEWDANPSRLTNRADFTAEANGFLLGAWAQANHCKGFEAHSNVGHVAAFLWLLGAEHHDEVEQMLTTQNVEFFGKPELVTLSELDVVDFDWRSADNGEWRTAKGSTPTTASKALAARAEK